MLKEPQRLNRTIAHTLFLGIGKTDGNKVQACFNGPEGGICTKSEKRLGVLLHTPEVKLISKMALTNKTWIKALLLKNPLGYWIPRIQLIVLPLYRNFVGPLLLFLKHKFMTKRTAGLHLLPNLVSSFIPVHQPEMVQFQWNWWYKILTDLFTRQCYMHGDPTS